MRDLNLELRDRFIKNFEFPINVPQSPLFENSLEVLEKYYKTKTEWKLWEKELESKSPGKVVQELLDTRNEILDFIKSSESFLKFQEEGDEFFDRFHVAESYPSTEIYNWDRIGKRYLSIDLRKANFQALRYYDPAIFLGRSSWEEFTSIFIDSSIFPRCKRIRQYIFGNLCPKRQDAIEKYLMFNINNQIKNDKLTFISFKRDELIYEVNPKEDLSEIIEDIKGIVLENGINPDIKIDDFILRGIQLFTHSGESILGFYKERNNGVISFHGIPKTYVQQFIKFFEGRQSEINDMDLTFLYNASDLVKYLYPLSESVI